jgi:hypothetical protein
LRGPFPQWFSEATMRVHHPAVRPGLLRLGVLPAVAALLVLTGCSSGDPQIAQLRTDPLIRGSLPGLDETQLFGQIGFTSLGTAQPATVTRLLRTGTRTVTNDDLADAAVQARNDGWRVRPGDRGTWAGSKRIARRPVELLIRRSRSSTYGVLVAVVLTERP